MQQCITLPSFYICLGWITYLPPYYAAYPIAPSQSKITPEPYVVEVSDFFHWHEANAANISNHKIPEVNGSNSNPKRNLNKKINGSDSSYFVIIQEDIQ